MSRVSKSIRKGLREAIAHAKGERGATTRKIQTGGTAKSRARPRLTPLQKSIREAREDIEAYLAGDPSRVEISTVKVARKVPSKRRKSKASKN